ncbi:MAG: hypothetical protein ACFHU9_14035 [Fluviicola sp.]
MEPIDSPVQLKFNSGNTLPPNFKIIAYICLLLFLGLIVHGAAEGGVIPLLIGASLFLLDLFAITQVQIVEINQKENFVHDYSLHLVFIKLGKKYPLDKYMYVTAMPFLESSRVYGRSSNSTTISNNYHTVTMFGNRLRGKRVLKKYDSKAEASEIAQKLADRLNLKHFDYDPKLVRAVLRGERTL